MPSQLLKNSVAECGLSDVLDGQSHDLNSAALPLQVAVAVVGVALAVVRAVDLEDNGASVTDDDHIGGPGMPGLKADSWKGDQGDRLVRRAVLLDFA